MAVEEVTETLPFYVTPLFLDSIDPDGNLGSRVMAEVSPHLVQYKIRGRLEPRLGTFVSDYPEKGYKYGSVNRQAIAFTDCPTISTIRDFVAQNLSVPFTGCLVNFYRTGSDKINPHSDTTKPLSHTTIASLSFGTTRRFHLRNKITRKKYFVDLEHNSLLVMHGDCQEKYEHWIEAEEGSSSRLNLTLRCLKVD